MPIEETHQSLNPQPETLQVQVRPLILDPVGATSNIPEETLIVEQQPGSNGEVSRTDTTTIHSLGTPYQGTEGNPEVVWATHYGENFENSPLGCPGATLPAGRADRLYHSADPTILAVGPERNRQWPCGTKLTVCPLVDTLSVRPLGETIQVQPELWCIQVVRVDSCPGCSRNVIDLSEAGHAAVCGLGTCRVSIELSDDQ